MQHRWHYIYVILYPALGYKFYYGSRITLCHPSDDINYFGSSKTFKRYNDANHDEYQESALKVILWAQKLPHCKKNTLALSKLEITHIKDALENTEYLGPDICLNRNYGGRVILTPDEWRQARVHGGRNAVAMRAGVHGLTEAERSEIRKLGAAAVAKKFAKTYTFINSAGQAVTFTNLRQFCRENGLCPAHMRSLNNGTRKSHKGWTKA